MLVLAVTAIEVAKPRPARAKMRLPRKNASTAPGFVGGGVALEPAKLWASEQNTAKRASANPHKGPPLGGSELLYRSVFFDPKKVGVGSPGVEKWPNRARDPLFGPDLAKTAKKGGKATTQK